MNVPVTLAGYTGRWRFRDAHLFSAWMASRPWDEGGTRVAMVRVPPAGCDELVREAIVREARAHEPHASRLRAERLDVAAGFEEALRGAIEAPQAPTQTERLRAAGRILADFYWLITVRAGEDGPAIRDDAQEFLDNCVKAGQHPTACVIVLHHGAPVSEARDFGVGCLADGVLQEAERGRDRLWRAFIASRLAWEAAGDLGLAMELDREVGGVGLGNEAQLEAALNGCAAARLARVPEETVRSTADYLLGNTGDGPNLARLEAELRRAGVLWRPVGERRSRPAPWLSRGLLQRDRMHEARHLLRAALVNGPLANEILRRCFDLESSLVASLWPKHRTLEDRLPEARDLLRRFREGRLHECSYYPPTCPASPRDAWCFASLGEVINGAPELGGRDSPASRLLRLRNALSHGHYVSWKTVADVLDLEDELGGG